MSSTPAWPCTGCSPARTPPRPGDCADFQSGVHDLIAPETFIGETANGLIKAERQKIIPLGEAVIHHADLPSTAPRFFPFRPHVSRALAIASMTRAGFYDCLFVALAEQERRELVTTDDRLVRNLQVQFPFIVPWRRCPSGPVA